MDQPEWDHYVNGRDMEDKDSNGLKRREYRRADQTLTSQVLHFAKNSNPRKKVVISAFGTGAFVNGLGTDDQEVARDITAEEIARLVDALHDEGIEVWYTDKDDTNPFWKRVNRQLNTLKSQPPIKWLCAIPGDEIDDDTIIVNAWDPHSLAGNGCKMDATIDGKLGEFTLLSPLHALMCLFHAHGFFKEGLLPLPSIILTPDTLIKEKEGKAALGGPAQQPAAPVIEKRSRFEKQEMEWEKRQAERKSPPENNAAVEKPPAVNTRRAERSAQQKAYAEEQQTARHSPARERQPSPPVRQPLPPEEPSSRFITPWEHEEASYRLDLKKQLIEQQRASVEKRSKSPDRRWVYDQKFNDLLNDVYRTATLEELLNILKTTWVAGAFLRDKEGPVKDLVLELETRKPTSPSKFQAYLSDTRIPVQLEIARMIAEVSGNVDFAIRYGAIQEQLSNKTKGHLVARDEVLTLINNNAPKLN